MKRKHLTLVWILTIVLATIITETFSHLYGADKVFLGSLILLPFGLAWCIITNEQTKVKERQRRYGFE